MQSMSENYFECFARTCVKSPATAMFEQINTQKSPQRDPMVRV
jgi:hypothetical protein